MSDPASRDLALEHLSWTEKLRRCYYRAVEVLLDRSLMDYVLVESFHRFRSEGEPYPFVRPTELRPGGVGEVSEHADHRSALVILLEEELPPELKTHIRARRPQEVVQKNLQRYLLRSNAAPEKISLMRDIESRATLESLRPLLELDYGLLVQQRPTAKKGMLNYSLTHFHVKIDEVLDRAIESFGLRLRYLSRSLFEQGEEYASLLEEKFFEIFGMKSTAAGRRTAAILAHTLLADVPGRHAVYVGSTEARSLTKIGKGDQVTRMCLVELDEDLRESVLKAHGVTGDALGASYAIAGSSPMVGILAVHYRPTAAGLPPADRKARKEIKTSERWAQVEEQLLLPQATAPDARPLPISWVYKK